jgi:hypothetical protein
MIISISSASLISVLLIRNDVETPFVLLAWLPGHVRKRQWITARWLLFYSIWCLFAQERIVGVRLLVAIRAKYRRGNRSGIVFKTDRCTLFRLAVNRSR